MSFAKIEPARKEAPPVMLAHHPFQAVEDSIELD
jgi:hypothetical protein